MENKGQPSLELNQRDATQHHRAKKIYVKNNNVKCYFSVWFDLLASIEWQQILAFCIHKMHTLNLCVKYQSLFAMTNGFFAE